MKIITETRPAFQVILAQHYGMCFGVKDAIKAAEAVAKNQPVTVLGSLAHNPTVQNRMLNLGATVGKLDESSAPTDAVLITAHGASDRDRLRWKTAGHTVTDTTCPLVHRAHDAMKQLVLAGFAPVVIGKRDHVEVRGLTGDFPEAQVVLTPEDIDTMEGSEKIGVISQTTQPIDLVELLVDRIRKRFPDSKVRFKDTVCRPTKDRQSALLKLCGEVELVIVVGGSHSNNTRQLTEKCARLGCVSYQVERPEDLETEWFVDIEKIGVTAGTSTPDEDVASVLKRLNEIAERN